MGKAKEAKPKSAAAEVIKLLQQDKLDASVDSLSKIDDVSAWVSTGCLVLDAIIGKGIPIGRITEFRGDPSSGKSLVGSQIIAMAQQMDYFAGYADTESAVSKVMMAMVGVDIDNLIYSDPDTIEDVFEFFDKTIDHCHTIDPSKPIVLVWDSVAATSVKQEMENEYGKATMGRHAAIISQSLRKFTRKIKHMNVAAVFINQTREKIGVMFGDNTTTFGGNAIPFHSSVRVHLDLQDKIVVPKKTGKGKKVIGMNTKATVIKNKVDMPFRYATFPIYFRSGIDDCEATLNYLIEGGLVTGSGHYKLVVPSTGELLSFTKKTWSKIYDEHYDEVEQLVFQVAADEDATGAVEEAVEE